MFSVDLQTQKVLCDLPDCKHWAKQLLSKSTLEDHHFGDIITATPNDFEHALRIHGFDGRVVSTTGPQEDRICLQKRDEQWHVFYYERGSRTMEKTFHTRREAERNILLRLIKTAWLELSLEFRNKHHPGTPLQDIPELQSAIAKFAQAWPEDQES